MDAHERALKAHQEGFAANAFGFLYCDNPYKEPGIERTAWFAGWQSAKETTVNNAYDTGWTRGYEHGKKAKTPCTAQLPPDATEYDEWLWEGYRDGYNYAQQETQQ